MVAHYLAVSHYCMRRWNECIEAGYRALGG